MSLVLYIICVFRIFHVYKSVSILVWIVFRLLYHSLLYGMGFARRRRLYSDLYLLTSTRVVSLTNGPHLFFFYCKMNLDLRVIIECEHVNQRKKTISVCLPFSADLMVVDGSNLIILLVIVVEWMLLSSTCLLLVKVVSHKKTERMITDNVL